MRASLLRRDTDLLRRIVDKNETDSNAQLMLAKRGQHEPDRLRALRDTRHREQFQVEASKSSSELASEGTVEVKRLMLDESFHCVDLQIRGQTVGVQTLLY